MCHRLRARLFPQATDQPHRRRENRLRSPARLPEPPASEHTARADNCSSSLAPRLDRSTRYCSSFDQEFRRPDQTNRPRQESVRPDRVPSRHIARLAPRTAVRFFFPSRGLVNAHSFLLRAEVPGSARLRRAGCGILPQRTFHHLNSF